MRSIDSGLWSWVFESLRPKTKNLSPIVLIVLVVAVVLLADSSADAQCSMCRAAVENATNSAKFIRNLNIGVLVLFVPPVAIFCTIFIALKRHRGNG